MMKRLTITGSTMRARNTAEKAEITKGLQEVVAPLWAKGECLPMIYKTFKFYQIQAAHTEMDTGEHVGKVVVEVIQNHQTNLILTIQWLNKKGELKLTFFDWISMIYSASN